MPKKQSKYHRRADGLLETTRVDKRTGKRIHFYGHTDREVDDQIMAYQGKAERGRLFKEVADEWNGIHFPTLAPNSLKNYHPAYERAIKEFGDTPINQIKAANINKFIADFSRGGKAKKTVSTQLLILNMIFSYAVGENDIEYNPCASISVPKNLSKAHRDAASPEDENRVKESADVWLLPYLIYYTGLRKGEALAIRDEDISEDNINVSKSVYFEGNTPKIKKPKTAAGIRTVPILDPLRKELPKKFTGYLFSADGGKTPLKESQYLMMWKDYQKKTGVTASAHQLRHSYATMLYEFGVDLKDAQNLLGHSTAAMTQDIYTHLREGQKKRTVDLLNQKLKEQNETK